MKKSIVRVIAACALAPPAAAQTCDPEWSGELRVGSTFGAWIGVAIPRSDGLDELIVVEDDLFTTAYRWTRWGWEPWAAPAPTPWRRRPIVMHAHDFDGDGPAPLRVIGGAEFDSLDPVGLKRGVAIRDPEGWSLELPNMAVWSLHSFDPDGTGPELPWLVAGGVPAQVAYGPGVWAKQGRTGEWRRLDGPSGYLSDVCGLATFDADGPGPEPARLCAGADRYAPGGAFKDDGVYRWNGADWELLGHTRLFNPVPGGRTWANHVAKIAVIDEDGAGPLPQSLCITGSFDDVSGAPVRNFARYRQGVWTDMSAGWDFFSHGVAAFVPFDEDGGGPRPPRLVAGRSSASPSVLVFDGARWTPLEAASARPLCRPQCSLRSLIAVGPLEGLRPEPALALLGGFADPQGPVGAGISELLRYGGCLCYDMNGDGLVNSVELGTLLGNWGTDGSGDLDESQRVDSRDLAYLLAAWGACP